MHAENTSVAQLNTLYAATRQVFPDRFIGLNYLGINPTKVVDRLPDDLDGLWIDSGICGHGFLNGAADQDVRDGQTGSKSVCNGKLSGFSRLCPCSSKYVLDASVGSFHLPSGDTSSSPVFRFVRYAGSGESD